MKSTGIVRSIDQLGRIVVPKELRNILDIGVSDSLEIYTEDNAIILKKYEPGCIFCSEVSGVSIHLGKNICPSCLKKLGGKR